MPKIKIGDVEAEEGSKAFGFLKVGTTAAAPIRIPIAILNGAKPGPKLCVLGGVHGAEHVGIDAVIRIIKNTNVNELNGALLISPVVNQINFERRIATFNPVDYLNQARVFPGDPDGSISYRIAHVIFSEVISKADYLIDCHGGEGFEDIGNYIIVGRGEDEEVNKKSLDMASCFDLKIVVPLTSKGTSSHACTLGIPSIVPEAGTPYPVRESQITWLYDGIVNVMKLLKMVEGEPRRVKPFVSRKGVFDYAISAKQGGIFHSFVERGEEVSQGQVVAEVTDLFGNVLDTYTAPRSGVVMCRMTYYAVTSGEPLLMIVPLE